MWVSRARYEEILCANGVEALNVAASRAEASTLREQNRVLQTNLDWMRHQINKLERQNATFVFKLTGITQDVPELATTTKAPADIASVLNELGGSFEDMGDEAATKLGVGWGKGGELEYGEPRLGAPDNE